MAAMNPVIVILKEVIKPNIMGIFFGIILGNNEPLFKKQVTNSYVPKTTPIKTSGKTQTQYAHIFLSDLVNIVIRCYLSPSKILNLLIYPNWYMV